MKLDKKYRLFINWIRHELNNYISVDETDELIRLGRSKNNGIDLSENDEEKQKIENIDLVFSSLKYRKSIDLLITRFKSKLDVEDFLSFLLKLANFSLKNSESELAVELCYRVIDLSKGIKSFSVFRANAYLLLSDSLSDKGYWEGGISFLKHAQKIFNESNDKNGLADIENRYGIINAEQGKVKVAAAHFESALNLLDPIKDKNLITKIKNNLGNLYIITGEYSTAEKMINDAYESFCDLSDAEGTANSLFNKGMLFLRQKKYDMANIYFIKSMNISVKNNMSHLTCIGYSAKAHLHTAKGNTEVAQRYISFGLNIAVKINDRLSIAEFYKLNGMILRDKKKFKTAENYLLTSLRINKELNNHLNIAETAFELGLFYKVKNEPEMSASYFKQALNYYRKNKISDEVDLITGYLNEVTSSIISN